MLVVLVVLSVLVPVLGESPQNRAVSLQGTRNTRDLGGLPARSGEIRGEMIYRSGALCFATPEDVHTLQGRRLKTIVELRLPQEIAKDGPDQPSLTRTLKVVHLPMGNSRGVHREAYVSYMAERQDVFRDFFELLADEDSYPLLFHCSAGKDRTGILTALLLMHLGTPREVILEDYLHSARISPRLRVEQEWIQVVFDTVDAAGGIGPYLTGIGIPQEQLDRIARLLVTPE